MDVHSFTLTIDGEVDNPVTLRYDQVLELPAVERTVRIICAGGTYANTVMKGVSMARLFDLAKVRGAACLAVFHCEDGHRETIPLVELLQQEAFLAYTASGEDADELGCLLRLAVPGKYGHKWAKWVRRVQLIADDR